MADNLVGRVNGYTALIGIIFYSQHNPNGKENDKQEECVISVYKNPKVPHSSSFDLKRKMRVRLQAVPTFYILCYYMINLLH